jgi:uncharacterized membrane protein YgaE (UPF0421/DUF939 family)
MRLSLKTTRQRRWTATLTRAAAGVGSAAGTAVTRLRGVAWAILQTSAAAALAWFIAHDLLGHAQPFFAPIAVAVCLSASNVLGGQRAVQMIFGVSLGIGVGVGVQALLGTGVFALGVAVLVALCLAVIIAQGFIAQGLMFFNQTAASAILVIALPHAGTGAERLFDALVGGGLALVVSVLLFPADPVALLRGALDSALSALSGTLIQLERIICQHGREPLDPGWALTEGEHLNQQLASVAQARSTARQMVRAPRRRAARPAVESLERQATQLTLLSGAVLNLARTTTAAMQSGEDVPAGLLAAISDLAAGLSGLAHHDTAAASQAATRAVGRMADQRVASSTRAPLIALLATACGRDLESLAALTGSGQRPDWGSRRGTD